MTCKTTTCNQPAIAITDSRGQVRRPTMSAPTHCILHAAGEACTRLINPSLNPAFTFTALDAHRRSAAGHKSQKGW
jgi:hypothetical protein